MVLSDGRFVSICRARFRHLCDIRNDDFESDPFGTNMLILSRITRIDDRPATVQDYMEMRIEDVTRVMEEVNRGGL